ncbi:hypothetical protein A6R68_23756 [Neotoma lepida]|uniref:Uncharacterized protein n=1 Tax=Neotoma lepida TaxID=56216 RepID=A0A1A6HW68_NEOLE|nr:hypothetical protein A6R68_23756 [Neotoma lepida]
MQGAIKVTRGTGVEKRRKDIDFGNKQYFHLLKRLVQTEEPGLTQDEAANASTAEFNLDIHGKFYSIPLIYPLNVMHLRRVGIWGPKSAFTPPCNPSTRRTIARTIVLLKSINKGHAKMVALILKVA